MAGSLRVRCDSTDEHVERGGLTPRGVPLRGTRPRRRVGRAGCGELENGVVL
jgi:hypothetical protein